MSKSPSKPRRGARGAHGLPGIFRHPPVGSRLRKVCETVAARLARDPGACRVQMTALKHNEELLEGEMIRRTLGLPAPRRRERLFSLNAPQHEAIAVLLVVRAYLCDADDRGRHENDAAIYRRVAEYTGPGIRPEDVRRCVQAFFDTAGRLALAAAYRPGRNPDYASLLSASLEAILEVHDNELYPLVLQAELDEEAEKKILGLAPWID